MRMLVLNHCSDHSNDCGRRLDHDGADTRNDRCGLAARRYRHLRGPTQSRHETDADCRREGTLLRQIPRRVLLGHKR
jgi:hypothetical protein